MKDLRVRQLARLASLYRAECDKYADKIEMGQFSDKLDRIEEVNQRKVKSIEEYLKCGSINGEDRQLLEEASKHSRELSDLVKSAQEYILSRAMKPKTKKVAQYET